MAGIKLWTCEEPFPNALVETHPLAHEVPGGMLDGLGKRQFVRYLGATPPTQAGLDAQVNPSTAQVAAETKVVAKRLLTDLDAEARYKRALARLVLKVNNDKRQWEAAFKAATATSPTFDVFKTRIAAIPATPDYTLAALQTLMQAMIDAETSPTV